ncbi:unnamed protein product [Anisakis simplex]|uniref:C3HC-type domain-containing protein n=1 Tax=Anisakis simplex TaxID=6269 RepID=A0A0M3JXK1_ANISI|nr:unnamed protein product [Anisakis simplex]
MIETSSAGPSTNGQQQQQQHQNDEAQEDHQSKRLRRTIELKRRATELLENAVQHTAITMKKARLSCPQKLSPDIVIKPTPNLKQRLLSFNLHNWSAKPKEISVQRFAQHGWSCVSPNLLYCAVCGAYLSAQLPSLTDVDDCAVFRAALLSKKMEENLNLKDVNIKHLTATDQVRKKFGISDQKIADLVCCGWMKSEKVRDAIECDYCAHTLGLWMYRKQNELDVEQAHYNWCQYTSFSNNCEPVWLSRLHLINDEALSSKKTSVQYEMITKRQLLDETIAAVN